MEQFDQKVKGVLETKKKRQEELSALWVQLANGDIASRKKPVFCGRLSSWIRKTHRHRHPGLASTPQRRRSRRPWIICGRI
jgi:hypothetical protein